MDEAVLHKDRDGGGGEGACSPVVAAALSHEHQQPFGIQVPDILPWQQVVRLKAENDRLRRDNERFVRLIDSGEWGRGRVAELVQVCERLAEFCTWQYRQVSHFALPQRHLPSGSS